MRCAPRGGWNATRTVGCATPSSDVAVVGDVGQVLEARDLLPQRRIERSRMERSRIQRVVHSRHDRTPAWLRPRIAIPGLRPSFAAAR